MVFNAVFSYGSYKILINADAIFGVNLTKKTIFTHPKVQKLKMFSLISENITLQVIPFYLQPELLEI